MPRSGFLLEAGLGQSLPTGMSAIRQTGMSALQTLVTLNSYGRVVLRRVLHHMLRAGTSRAQAPRVTPFIVPADFHNTNVALTMFCKKLMFI